MGSQIDQLDRAALRLEAMQHELYLLGDQVNQAQGALYEASAEVRRLKGLLQNALDIQSERTQTLDAKRSEYGALIAKLRAAFLRSPDGR